MAKIACPGCKKSYEVPASAAGRVATCKACGKKFRLGAKPKSAAASPKSAPQPKPKPAREVAAAAESSPQPSPKPSDSFWDDALDESFEVEAPAAEPVNHMAAATLAAADAEANKPVKKVRWGFQWEKFFGGLAVMVLAGGAAAAIILTTGSVRRHTAALIVVAFGGLFTMISGLMGEEGIW